MKKLLLFVGCILLSLVGCSQDIIEQSRTFKIEAYNISLKKEGKLNPSNRSRPLLSNDPSRLDTILVDKGHNFQYGTESGVTFSVKIEYLLESRFSQDSVKLKRSFDLLGSDKSVDYGPVKFPIDNTTITGMGGINKANNAKVDSYYILFNYPRVIYFTFYKAIDRTMNSDFRENTIKSYLVHVL